MAITPTSGELNQRITFEDYIESIDLVVPRITTLKAWAPIANGECWAQVEQLRGRELFAQGQSHAPVDLRVIVRMRSDITGAMRIRHGDAVYSIVGKPIVMRGRRFLEIMCTDDSGNTRVEVG